jgi:hypothetical protein
MTRKLAFCDLCGEQKECKVTITWAFNGLCESYLCDDCNQYDPETMNDFPLDSKVTDALMDNYFGSYDAEVREDFDPYSIECSDEDLKDSFDS